MSTWPGSTTSHPSKIPAVWKTSRLNSKVLTSVPGEVQKSVLQQFRPKREGSAQRRGHKLCYLLKSQKTNQ